MTKSLDLVGVAEIAEYLGVSRQYVHKVIGKSDDFPEPVATLSAGKIWMRNDVVAWDKRRKRAPKA